MPEGVAVLLPRALAMGDGGVVAEERPPAMADFANGEVGEYTG